MGPESAAGHGGCGQKDIFVTCSHCMAAAHWSDDAGCLTLQAREVEVVVLLVVRQQGLRSRCDTFSGVAVGRRPAGQPCSAGHDR